MGNNILNQGFDNIDWAGVFEIAPKGGVYWNNVNADGDIITDEYVTESDKIKLKNDGIFLHEAEGGGGGIIYFKEGKYNWIQQD